MEIKSKIKINIELTLEGEKKKAIASMIWWCVHLTQRWIMMSWIGRMYNKNPKVFAMPKNSQPIIILGGDWSEKTNWCLSYIINS